MADPELSLPNPDLAASNHEGPSLEDARAQILEIYERRYLDLVGYAKSFVQAHHLAEDIVQIAFEKALLAADTFRQRGIPMEGWIFRITHNAAIDYHRRPSRREIPTGPELLPSIRDADPERAYLAKEALTHSLGSITTESQLKVVIDNAAGYSRGEIMTRWQLTQAATDGLLHRGRKTAKEALKEYKAA